MLAIDSANESLQRHLEFSTAIEPGPVDPIAGAIDITTPNAFETHQDIALNGRPKFFELIGEWDWRFAGKSRDRSERPFVLWPIIRGDQVGRMTQINQATGETLEISFGPAAGRKATA